MVDEFAVVDITITYVVDTVVVTDFVFYFSVVVGVYIVDICVGTAVAVVICCVFGIVLLLYVVVVGSWFVTL